MAGKDLASIERLLYSIKMQNFKDYEVVIATESNGDKLEELCKKLNMDCRVIETGYWNRCITGNIGILRSRGKPVAILENDVVLEPSWLTKLVAVLTSDKGVGCTYSAVIYSFGSEPIVVKTNKKAVQFIAKTLNTLRVHNHFVIFVRISKYETFGLGAAEAMAYGAIPIITPIVGTADIIVSEVNGFIIRAEVELAKILKPMDGHQLMKLRINAIATARMYLWDNIAKKLVDLIAMRGLQKQC